MNIIARLLCSHIFKVISVSIEYHLSRVYAYICAYVHTCMCAYIHMLYSYVHM